MLRSLKFVFLDLFYIFKSLFAKFKVNKAKKYKLVIMKKVSSIFGERR